MAQPYFVKQKSHRGIIIFSIIVIAILGFLFYYFENPFSSSGEYQNISIYAVDSITNKQVETGYIIKVNNAIYDYGNTSKDYVIRKQVPMDSYVEIISKNIEEQGYYEKKIRFFTNSSIPEPQRDNPKRIKIVLEKPGTLNIQKSGLLHVVEEPKVHVSTDTILKDLVVCVDWSFHFFFAEAIDLNSTEKIKDKENCYILKKTLEKGETTSFEIDYKKFGIPTSNDYILLDFYDSRYNPQNKQEPIKSYKYYY